MGKISLEQFCCSFENLINTLPPVQANKLKDKTSFTIPYDARDNNSYISIQCPIKNSNDIGKDNDVIIEFSTTGSPNKVIVTAICDGCQDNSKGFCKSILVSKK